jgi:hypothetical protein
MENRVFHLEQRLGRWTAAVTTALASVTTGNRLHPLAGDRSRATLNEAQPSGRHTTPAIQPVQPQPPLPRPRW